MASYTENVEEKKDSFYLETLALPGEINSIVVGRFFNRNIETLILAKSTFLSIFHNSDEEDSFDFVDHICVYKEVYSLCTSVQPHSLDCLFVLSIGGEWLLLQWNKARFFPLATGSILKSIQPLMKTPEQHRFRLDPTFQWAVSVVPITDNQPRFFTRPSPQNNEQQDNGLFKPIIRISFRAVIAVDETVFVGVKYDGPDSIFLSAIKDNWLSALKQFPKKFGFFDSDNKHGYKEENINTTIRNGLENEWKVLQTIEENKKNLCIANAETFIFFEDDEDQPNYQSNKQEQEKEKEINPSTQQKKNKISLFQSIVELRHLTFTTAMRLEPFPIKKKPYFMPSFPFAEPLNREKDGEVVCCGLNENSKQGRIQLPEFVSSYKNMNHQMKNLEQRDLQDEQQQQQQQSIDSKSENDESNQSCVTAIALLDQPVDISVISVLFDFEHHRISLHSFIITALPLTSCRLMPVLDETRVMKTLKGEEIKSLNRVHAGNVNIVKGAFAITNEFLIDYYSNKDKIQENNEDLNLNINKSKPNSFIDAINRLHTHIQRQQAKVNTFLITFPNKKYHKYKLKPNRNNNNNIEDQEEYSTSDESPLSNIYSDSSDNLLLTLNQQEMIDDSNQNDSLIFTKNSNMFNNSLSEQLPILNYHPFLIFTSVGIGLFTSHLTQYNFIYPIPFPQPPLSILYIGGQEKEKENEYNSNKTRSQQITKISSKNELNSKRIRRHNQQKDVNSLDKLFIASGNTLIIITNGQVQRHTYPYKWFNELAMTNGANWYLPAQINQQQSSTQTSIDKVLSPVLSYQSSSSDQTTHSSNQQQLSSVKSSFQSNIDNIQLKLGTSMLFIVSASNSSMIVDLYNGSFFEFPGRETDIKELGEGGPEDFQYNPMCINSIVPLPYYSYSPHHSIDDRFVLGVGNGRSGAIHSIGIGHKLQSIMQGKWYEKLPTIFTSRAYSGARLHSLLLVEEEKLVEFKNEGIFVQNKDGSKTQIQSKQKLYPTKYSVLLNNGNNNLRNTYISQIFQLREDTVEPIEPVEVGIDNQEKTISFGSVQGAIVQISSSEIRVIPTLRFFIHQKKQQQQQQEDEEELNKQIDQQDQNQNIQKQMEIVSEFIGYDVNNIISFPTPYLFTEEQCQQRIQEYQQNQLNFYKNKKQNKPSSSSQLIPLEKLQSITFEYACITDNLIAVSYKCIVYVLIWNPSKPKIQSNSSNQKQSQSEIQSSSIKYSTAILHPISTLCFSSPVKSLSASTICTRPFLVVGCETPPAVFLFRLDTLQISQQQISIRNKIWDDGEQLLDQMKYKLAYPTVQRPDPELVIQNGVRNSYEFNQLENKHSIRIGDGNQCSILQSESLLSPIKQFDKERQTKQIRFIEVLSGSHQYVEVFYSANITMTRILDLFPYDRPDQILLTTFGNQICIYTTDETKNNTINSAITISPSNLTQQSQVAQSSEMINQDSQRSYLQNDGAALMIAGHNGQLATALIPLSAILDFPPELQKKDKNGGKTKFFFPSVVTTMRLFPQIVKIAEDGQIVYLYGDRAFALTWNYISCQIMWSDLECTGIIHSLAPMRVVDEQPTLSFKQDQESIDGSDKQSQKGSQVSSKGDDTQLTQIPHPTIAWIDYVEQRLTFGTIDKRRIITRQIKDLSSLPLSIAHIPTMHAIAVLCREYSQYPYYQPKQEDNESFDKIESTQTILGKQDSRKQQQQQQQQQQSQITQYVNNTKSISLIGLGLDVSGIFNLEQQMFKPFHNIFINYLESKWKIRQNNQLYQDTPSSNNETKKTEINSSDNNNGKLQLQGQFFHESIPEKDFKGDPFIDIAADWFIESHTKHFKDFRPKRFPPYKFNVPKVNLCYSSQKTNFSFGYPSWLSPANVKMALKNRSLRLNRMKKQSIFVGDKELLMVKDENVESKFNGQNDIQINENLPLPKDNQKQHSIIKTDHYSQQQTSSEQNIIKRSNSFQNTVNQQNQSYDEYVRTVSNSFMIILYDEAEMHLRIGQINLSNMNLDFGKKKNNKQQQSSSQQQLQPIEPQTVDNYYNLNTEETTTQLYNYFSMVCVTIPTWQGLNEQIKVQRSTINELKQASKELQYDTNKLDNINQTIEDIENIETESYISDMQKIINFQQQLTNIKNNETQQSNQCDGNVYLNKQIEIFENLHLKFDKNEYLNQRKKIIEEQKQKNKQTQIKTDLLSVMNTDEFNERFARSLLCVLGRESSVGSSEQENSSNKEDSQSKQQVPDIENETFNESMITDIFIFEVVRHHILENSRNITRQILEEQLNENEFSQNKSQSNNNNLIHFGDNQIQNAIDESDKILHTYADLSTSPMTAIYNRMKILNISLTLQKRIRVIGGVQGIYGFPSTLVVLNGKAAFVFIVGSRLDDNEVTTLNKIYKLDSMKADLHNANQSKKQEVIKNNLKNINEQLKNPLQENNNEYICSEYCSCTNPLFSENQNPFSSTPFHASVANVRNLNDSKGQLLTQHRLNLSKMKQYYTYNNEISAVPTRSIESYLIPSHFTFNIRNISLIIAPSPITNFTLQQAFYHPTISQLPNSVLSFSQYDNLSSFRGLTINHKKSNIIPSYMMVPQHLRAALIFAPTGFAFVDIQINQPVHLNHSTFFQRRRLCAFNPKDGELVEQMIAKSKQIINAKKNTNKNQNMNVKLKNKRKSKQLTNTSNLIQNFQYIPPSLQVFHKKSDQEKIQLPKASIMPLGFAQPRCRHCNKDFGTYHNNPINQLHIQQNRNLSNKPDNITKEDQQDNKQQIIDKQSIIAKSIDVNKTLSQIKLPQISASDLASVAGIQLKHRPQDLVRTASLFCHRSRLIAQAYSPTLIIDSAQLGINQFGIVGDLEILIYTMLPNPLYKKMKQKISSKIIRTVQYEGYEYLPMCLVLNVRIPNYQHFSFIQRCNSGSSAIFGGIRNNLFKKMFNNIELLKQQFQEQQEQIQVKSSKDQNITNEQSNQLEVNNNDSNYAIIEKVEGEEENELYAEDLDDEQQLSVEQQSRIIQSQITVSPKGALQNLPSIPSFAIFSRSGEIMRSALVTYDNIPIMDLFLIIHVLAMNDMNFGDIWSHGQQKAIQDYHNIETKTFRLSIVEQALREFISTGRIARQPPVPLYDYIPNIYGLRNGRFTTSQVVFGLSPLPINSEFTTWKNLTYRKITNAFQQFILYMKNMSQHRFIIREVIRRIIKSYESSKYPEGTQDNLQFSNLETLLQNVTYALYCSISKPLDMLHEDIPSDIAKYMQFLTKQSRIGIKQLFLSMKYPKGNFIQKLKTEFQHSLNRERKMDYQLWYKYRNEILDQQIGIYSNKNFRFNDDPSLDGNVPEDIGSNLIKISKKSGMNLSEYSFDITHISEKLSYNKYLLENSGLNLNFNRLFKSLVKESKIVQMASRTKELYIKIHLNSIEEISSSEEESNFMSKFQQDQFPVYMITPLKTVSKQQIDKPKQISRPQQQQTKQNIPDKELQPKKKDQLIKQPLKLQKIPSFNPKKLNQQQTQINLKEVKLSLKQIKEKIQNIDKEIIYKIDVENDTKPKIEKKLYQEKYKDIKKMCDKKSDKKNEKDSMYEKSKDVRTNKDQNNRISGRIISQQINEGQIQNIQHPLTKSEKQQTVNFNQKTEEKLSFQQLSKDKQTNQDQQYESKEVEQEFDILDQNIVNIQKSQLQRIQFNVHFPHFNKTQQDLDWSENIETIPNNDSRMKSEQIDIDSQFPINSFNLNLSNLESLSNENQPSYLQLSSRTSNISKTQTFQSHQQTHSHQFLSFESIFDLSNSPMIIADNNPPMPETIPILILPSGSSIKQSQNKHDEIPIVAVKKQDDGKDITDVHQEVKDESDNENYTTSNQQN